MSDCSTETFKAKEPHARMTKTKAQLRAEAVERLRKLNCMDVDCYQLLEAAVDDAGEKVGYRVEIRKLIDLLTDDETCPNSDGTCPDADGTPSIEQGDGVAKLDAQARAEIEDAERSRAVSGDAAAEVDAGTGGTEKTPQEPRECGRITFTDTREMLDEDVRRWFADDYYDDYYSEEDMNAVVSRWLDRQAAITRMEDERACHDCTIEQVEALQAKVDALEAECQKDSENAADFEDSCDTRDELEYDCKWMAYAWAPDEFPDDKLEKKLYREIIDKLDRQAAITERECRKPNWDYCETCELQAKVDELEAEKRECMEDCANRVSAAIFERDRYRDKLGRAIDAAHEVVRIMEVEQ